MRKNARVVRVACNPYVRRFRRVIDELLRYINDAPNELVAIGRRSGDIGEERVGGSKQGWIYISPSIQDFDFTHTLVNESTREFVWPWIYAVSTDWRLVWFQFCLWVPLHHQLPGISFLQRYKECCLSGEQSVASSTRASFAIYPRRSGICSSFNLPHFVCVVLSVTILVNDSGNIIMMTWSQKGCQCRWMFQFVGFEEWILLMLSVAFHSPEDVSHQVKILFWNQLMEIIFLQSLVIKGKLYYIFQNVSLL